MLRGREASREPCVPASGLWPCAMLCVAQRVDYSIAVRSRQAGQVGSAGLPVGVQVAARPWREHVALAAMQAIEWAVGPAGA